MSHVECYFEIRFFSGGSRFVVDGTGFGEVLRGRVVSQYGIIVWVRGLEIHGYFLLWNRSFIFCYGFKTVTGSYGNRPTKLIKRCRMLL